AGGFLLFGAGGKMNDCPRRYTQKSAACWFNINTLFSHPVVYADNLLRIAIISFVILNTKCYSVTVKQE
ncbi:hypothetical protein RCN31_03625, partial [Escherichia marmotae]|nr:hypothetical protein [Escherichia coli]MED9621059.1 hypothetical protein [Escherichia marmotae]